MQIKDHQGGSTPRAPQSSGNGPIIIRRRSGERIELGEKNRETRKDFSMREDLE